MNRINTVDVVGTSGILKVKQKLGVTFNSDKEDIIDFNRLSRRKRGMASLGLKEMGKFLWEGKEKSFFSIHIGRLM